MLDARCVHPLTANPSSDCLFFASTFYEAWLLPMNTNLVLILSLSLIKELIIVNEHAGSGSLILNKMKVFNS